MREGRWLGRAAGGRGMGGGPEGAREDGPLRGTELKRFHRAARAGRSAGPAITFVCDNVQDPVNVGAIFRLADAVRAREIVLGGTSALPGQGRRVLAAAARGREAVVPWRHEPEVALALRALRAGGTVCCAVEIAGEALPYHQTAYPHRLALVVGNEEYGVTRRALAECELRVFIPMFGRGRSLNVAMSLAVVAYRAVLPGGAQAGS